LFVAGYTYTGGVSGTDFVIRAYDIRRDAALLD
jgi:hypothetical protein